MVRFTSNDPIYVSVHETEKCVGPYYIRPTYSLTEVKLCKASLFQLNQIMRTCGPNISSYKTIIVILAITRYTIIIDDATVFDT